MAINRSAVALLIAGITVTACKEHRVEPSHRMSDDFAICVNLPQGAVYQLQKRSFDYEIGQLTLAGNQLEVYIGYQPPYSGKPWPRGSEITNGFVVVGKERSDGIEQLLLGNKRQTNRGPVFVMFSAPDLRAAEPALTRKNFVFDCK